MIYTWIADVSPLYFPPAYEAVYSNLPPFRREKAEKLKPRQKKAQSAGAWALLEAARERYGIPREAAFNISHSGDFCICSVCTKPGPFIVGCDIEKIGHVGLPAAKRLFCPSEYRYISGLEDEYGREEAACRFWVLKESFMKAVKKGLSLGTRNIEFRLGTVPALLKKPEGLGCGFVFREYAAFGIPYRIAVCAGGDAIAFALRMEFIDYFREGKLWAGDLSGTGK